MYVCIYKMLLYFPFFLIHEKILSPELIPPSKFQNVFQQKSERGVKAQTDVVVFLLVSLKAKQLSKGCVACRLLSKKILKIFIESGNPY